jgi:hypothetical protein
VIAEPGAFSAFFPPGGVVWLSIGIDEGDLPGPIREPNPGHVRRDRNLSKRLFFAATGPRAGPSESFLPGRQ